MAKNRKKGLGRGINKLMQMHNVSMTEVLQNSDYLASCPIEQIVANSSQPRKTFSEVEIEELSRSIKLNGILQPVLVRKLEEDKYEIVAGERRWRAAKLAGLTEIPILVKELSNKEVLILAIIENVHRKDLSSIEEAKAYKVMMETYSITQNQLSDIISKNRATIANILRLLKLPAIVQDMIDEDKISMGHGKVLLSLSDEEMIIKLSNKIVNEQLSVRALESIIKNLNGKKEEVQKVVNTFEEKLLISKLSSRFDIKVKIKASKNKNKGKILLEYKNEDELKRITDILLGEEDEK